MTRNLACIVALSAIAPLAVEFPAAGDSSATRSPLTRVAVAGGVASYSYVARGCEGQVLDEVGVHARDASVSIEQDLGATPLRAGVRGGWTRDRIDTTTSGYFPEVPLGRTLTNRYVNPYLSLETRKGGFGAGYVFHDREFPTAGEGARLQADHPLNDVSAHMRIGDLDRGYFDVRWMESEPLYSDGGYLTMGFGVRLRGTRLRLHSGVAAGGPYEGADVFLRGECPLGSGFSLSASGRGGAGGTGGSLRLGYTHGWRRPERGLVVAP